MELVKAHKRRDLPFFGGVDGEVYCWRKVLANRAAREKLGPESSKCLNETQPPGLAQFTALEADVRAVAS
jgi:hypothetical protein